MYCSNNENLEYFIGGLGEEHFYTNQILNNFKNINGLLLNIFVKIKYNIRIKKYIPNTNFNSLLIILHSENLRDSHTITLIKNNNIYLLYDCNFGIYQLDTLEHFEELIKIIKISYHYTSHTIYNVIKYFQY